MPLRSKVSVLYGAFESTSAGSKVGRGRVAGLCDAGGGGGDVLAYCLHPECCAAEHLSTLAAYILLNTCTVRCLLLRPFEPSLVRRAGECRGRSNLQLLNVANMVLQILPLLAEGNGLQFSGGFCNCRLHTTIQSRLGLLNFPPSQDVPDIWSMDSCQKRCRRHQKAFTWGVRRAGKGSHHSLCYCFCREFPDLPASHR